MNSQLEILLPENFDGKYIESENLKLIFYENFFSNEECDYYFDQLLNNILWEHPEHSMFGKRTILKRRVAWYGNEGKNYSYSSLSLKPNPWNELLLDLKKRIEKISNTKFNSVLLNDYPSGDIGMGWHSDDEKELGNNPVIGSISFGVSRDFYLRHKTKKELEQIKIRLNNGSYLLMLGATQHNWSHSIPKRKQIMERRINLTFRKII